jgi:hypothetical protein
MNKIHHPLARPKALSDSRWLLGLGGTLLLALAGCDVSVGKCDRDDAGHCIFEDDDEDGGDDRDSGRGDAGKDGSVADGGVDGAVADGGVDGGGTDAGTDASIVGTPIDLETFCAAQLQPALAWRDAFDLCCPASIPADVTDFLKDVLLYVEDAQGACVTARSASSKVTYDATKAAACAAEFAKGFAQPPASCPATGFDLEIFEGMIGHGAQSLAQIPACREAFKGSTKQGDPCTDPLECAAGLRCSGVVGTKTCQKAVELNGGCEGDGECVGGLTCAGSSASGGKQCRELATSTATCSRSKECESGLVCRTINAKDQCTTATASTPVCK